MDGREPGTVSVLEPRYPSDFPRVLTAHDIGLRDLIESAALVGALPTIYLVTISIAAVQPMEMALSPAIAAAIVPACAAVRDLLSSLTAGRREPNV